jgi:hypothetical protein
VCTCQRPRHGFRVTDKTSTFEVGPLLSGAVEGAQRDGRRHDADDGTSPPDGHRDDTREARRRRTGTREGCSDEKGNQRSSSGGFQVIAHDVDNLVRQERPQGLIVNPVEEATG